MLNLLGRRVSDAFRRFKAATPQQALEDLQSHLDSSKPFTSFIDLVSKLGVIYAFSVFCRKKAQQHPVYSLEWFDLSTSASIALILSGVLTWKICSIVIAYYFKDVTLWQSVPMKLLMVVIGIWCYFSLLSGIFELSSSLANAPWIPKSQAVITFSPEP